MKTVKVFFSLFLILVSSVANLQEADRQVNIVDYLPKGYLKNASVDYTSVIQKVLDTHRKVVFPDFPILINDNGLTLKSNSEINNAYLVMKPTNKRNYALLNIVEIRNVKLTNLHLKGDRYNHLDTKGEWGMGIYIKHASDITIDNSIIEEFWGDGIDITKRNGMVPSDIIIDNVTFKKNRRNGITISSGNNIIVQNCKFLYTDGVKPKAAIDIEPNSPIDSLGNIKINNIYTSENGTGIQISMMNFPSVKKQSFFIEINKVKSVGDGHGILVRDFYRKNKYGPKSIPLDGVVKFSNVEILNSKEEPIKFFNNKEGYEYGPKYIFSKFKIKNDKNNTKKTSIEHIIGELKKRGFYTNDFKK